MARNVADACMFCGEIHKGVCGGTPARPKLTKTSRPPRAVAPAVPPSVSAPGPTRGDTGKVGPSEVTANTEPALSAKQQARPDLSTVERVMHPEVAAEMRAITVFADAGLLGASELERLRDKIQLPPHQVDAMIWKEVNREEVRKRG